MCSGTPPCIKPHTDSDVVDVVPMLCVAALYCALLQYTAQCAIYITPSPTSIPTSPYIHTLYTPNISPIKPDTSLKSSMQDLGVVALVHGI